MYLNILFIGINDNFGSSVVLFNKKDAITWSDSNIQKEIISASKILFEHKLNDGVLITIIDIITKLLEFLNSKFNFNDNGNSLVISHFICRS